MKAGRRPGPSTAADDILTAARELFAARGYHDTTVRAVAAAAGVNSALVHHYFGGKEQLFVASMDLPFNPADVLASLAASGPRAELPDRLTRFFVHAWRDPSTGPALQAAVRGAVGTEQGAARLRSFAEGVLLERAAAVFGVPKPRVAAAIAQLIGYAVLRHLVGIAPLAELSEDEAVELLLPAVRGHLA